MERVKNDVMPNKIEARARKNRRIYWLWISAVIILLDQLSKTLVVRHLELYERIELTSFFNLIRLHNYGAAWSFLGDASGWQHWLFIGLGLVVSVGIIFWMRTHQTMPRIEAIALSLLVGGALGNVIDRVAYGYVVDFADFYWLGCGKPFIWIMPQCHWPAFNVADVAISCAAVLLIFSAFFPGKTAESSS